MPEHVWHTNDEAYPFLIFRYMPDLEEAPFYLESGHEVHVITTIPEDR